jgi:hypothetical protein
MQVEESRVTQWSRSFLDKPHFRLRNSDPPLPRLAILSIAAAKNSNPEIAQHPGYWVAFACSDLSSYHCGYYVAQ